MYSRMFSASWSICATTNVYSSHDVREYCLIGNGCRGSFAMQDFPLGNLHAHSQPLLAYLRLQGVEPSTSGTRQTLRAAQAVRRNVLESDL